MNPFLDMWDVTRYLIPDSTKYPCDLSVDSLNCSQTDYIRQKYCFCARCQYIVTLCPEMSFFQSIYLQRLQSAQQFMALIKFIISKVKNLLIKINREFRSCVVNIDRSALSQFQNKMSIEMKNVRCIVHSLTCIMHESRRYLEY